MSINNEVRTVDNLNADVRLILEEITRFLNMEKLLPSFRNTITIRYHAECVLVFQHKVVSEIYKTQLFSPLQKEQDRVGMSESPYSSLHA